MIDENINKITNKTKVLVAPLDWGLGHTTRCIPIIKLLTAHNAEVLLAAEGTSAALLKEAFPELKILSLKGYRIRYASNRKLFFMGMLAQLPKIRSVINNEHKWLKKIVQQYKIDAVIADNRFGFSHASIPCVYITHQLFIETNSDILNKLAQKIHYSYINKFSECWVPDHKEGNGFAGILSHPKKPPLIPVVYTGILSRCKKILTEKKNDLLIILSGPEPQRSIFENILLQQINNISGSINFVRGLPGSKQQLQIDNKNVSVHNHLPADELNVLIQQSRMIVARCGYSTIMDLAVLQQHAILVPTPGQTEQEYLATYLKEKRYFFTISQQHFLLNNVLEEIKDFDFADIDLVPSQLDNTVSNWLNKINNIKAGQ